MATDYEIQDLMDAIGGDLDLDATNDAARLPSEDEVKVWALDCLRLLLPFAPEHALDSVLTSETETDNPVDVADGGDLTSDTLKIVRAAHEDGDQMTWVDPDKFSSIAATYSNASNHGQGFRLWSIIGGNLRVFRAAATDNVTVHYIKSITAWTAGDTDPEDYIQIPHGWEPLISQYCTIKAKVRDQEIDQAQLLWEMYRDMLQRFAGFVDVPISVGG